MMTPPLLPISGEQERKDSEHVKLLAVFHFVICGLAILGLGFLCMHYLIMSSVFSNPEMWKGKNGAGPPPEFFQVFRWFYVFMGLMLILASVANVLSGVFLLRRKHRMFSLIVAGVNCLQFPFGTALGVITIIVLLRDSVRQSYVV